MASRHVGNLPTDMSSFVGRAEEVRDLRQMFARTRLVSVIGPGGVGKSRLAVRVGSQLERAFRDGVWLVELSSVSTAYMLPEAVAGALRVPEGSGRDSAEALTQYLADRELILLLDNCERLRDACAALVTTILPNAPGLRVLATSQEVLGLPGEAIYRLEPLAVPEVDPEIEVAEVSPAVALFADRAADSMHGFTVTTDNVNAVVELCRRLDGMPLAIELAAAQARFLSPAQILERIHDRFHLLAARSRSVPVRHQSLKAAVEWSYDLCSKPERLMWNRLSVFPSTFDLGAAEAVCTGAGLTDDDVEDSIAELVDRSVLIPEPRPWGMQYRLLESIREFGLRMLRESQESEHAVPESMLRARHLRWYAALAEDFDRDWFGPGQREWLERLHADLPNIRAALAFARDDPTHVEQALLLAGNLAFFWRVSALREGESWLKELLRPHTEPSLARARAVLALAWLLAARGHPEGMAVAEEAVATAETHDPHRVPRALAIRGTFMNAADLAQATTLFQDALSRATEIGSTSDRAFALFGLGWSLGLAGKLDDADLCFRESLGMSEEAGELWWRGGVQFRHALVDWLHDDKASMAAAAVDSLRASRVVPDLLTCANALAVIGVTSVGRDDLLAARLFGAAERYWADAAGSPFAIPPWISMLEAAKGRCRAGLGNDAFDGLHREGWSRPLADAMGAALDERPKQGPDHHVKHDFGLTRREREVVELVSQGLTNREIATALVISVRTAETHVQNILMKTGFATRSQLAAWHASRASTTDGGRLPG